MRIARTEETVPERRKVNEVQIAQTADTERQLNTARLEEALETQGEIVLYVGAKLYLGGGQQVHLRKAGATFKLKSARDAEKVLRGLEKWAKEFGI